MLTMMHLCIILCMYSVAETWRRVWGDGKTFRGPRFLNDAFPEKISIFTPKISYDFFLVIDQVFQILRFFTVLKCHIRPFLHKKNHYLRKEFLDKTISSSHPTTLLL